jgi:hypothetical protein
MIKDSNMAKILDGNYDNKASGRATNKVADQLNDFYNMMGEWVSESEG